MELNTMVLRGRVGSEVTFKNEPDSKPYARFRMAVSRSRRTDDGTWEEMESNWYTVKAWGILARNLAFALRKGHPIVVVGRPAAQAWKNDENQVLSALAIHAITIGHDLGLGVSTFSRIDRESGGQSTAPVEVNPDTGVIEGTIEMSASGLESDPPGEGVANTTAPREENSPGSGSNDDSGDSPPF